MVKPTPANATLDVAAHEPALANGWRRLGSGITHGTGWAVSKGHGLYLRLRTRAEPLEPLRLEAAVQCRRPRALSFGLLLFVAGMTLDDLRVLRWPAYAVGAGLAVLFIAFGPLTMGRALAATHKSESLAEFQARASRLRRLDLLGLLVAILATAAWLTVFSSGVPPWAR